MKCELILIAAFVLLTGSSYAGENGPFVSPEERISYSLGFQIGGDLKGQGMDIDPESIMKGVEEALAGAKPDLNPEEMNSVLLSLKKNIVNSGLEARKLEQEKTKERYRAEGRDFLAKNAGKEGVITRPSGLQYQIIEKGSGKSPGPYDTVTIHYRGTLIDGAEFDSSYRRNRPTEFRVDGVIRGWTEALQLMKEGARWRIFLPADLAYGERGPLADRTVIFDTELISVQKGK